MSADHTSPGLPSASRHIHSRNMLPMGDGYDRLDTVAQTSLLNQVYDAM
ncbi:MAG: hypothetical protein HPY64_10985 [Anaerolineae bacterium]|nr:hypothetical protein [Anaerolineae bacterium]